MHIEMIRKKKYMENNKELINETGVPIAENEHSLTAGPRGSAVLRDAWLLEKLAHFDREVIPERRMHAKGWGAYGKLVVTHDISQWTRAKVLQPEAEIKLFLRFSIVAGERGAAGTERDIRGVAVKFYTEEGNWDLVGNNTSTFFLRDAHNSPDLNRAVKRDPQTGMRLAQNNWDFWTLLPKTFHQTTIVMSDRGMPTTFRHMHLFGEHTFSLYNEKNERAWCKLHFKTQQRIKSLTDEEAEMAIAKDRESHGRDLSTVIEKGDYPRWTMYVQIMTEEQAKKHYKNPFDTTKIWRYTEFPLHEAGMLELNRNPENYFVEAEQVAFTPAHAVSGIGFSPDKPLQGRLFVYSDVQRYRLGANYNQISVNRAKYEAHDYYRDSLMRTDGNYGGASAYSPNGQGEWAAQSEVMEPPLDLFGAFYAYDPQDDPTGDRFRTGGDLWRVTTEDKRTLPIEDAARNIESVTDNIKYRHAVHCFWADEEYGRRVTEALGLDMERVKELTKGDHKALMKATI